METEEVSHKSETQETWMKSRIFCGLLYLGMMVMKLERRVFYFLCVGMSCYCKIIFTRTFTTNETVGPRPINEYGEVELPPRQRQF